VLRPNCNDRSGSFTTDALEATQSCMSALPPKADMDQRDGNVRLVPTAAVSSRSKVIPYSITSSARASSVGDISTPSAFAVPRLMTSSNLVARSTGMSAGLAPFRIRPA
jgi:hypothetical protein